MKRFTLLFLICSLTATAGYSQSMVNRTNETLGLKELTFDFGRIPQGKPVVHNFEVVNNGKKPLIIENVQASCGCTTPEWTAEPVPPGGKTIIRVGFNASSEGLFKKSITIDYNGDEVKTLMISGQVYPTPTTSAPVNSSLSLLKQ
jgi:hypothetical protein